MDRADLVEGVYDPEKLGGYNEETMSADVVAAIKEQKLPDKSKVSRTIQRSINGLW